MLKCCFIFWVADSARIKNLFHDQEKPHDKQ
ncbi:MAG: hypothetical protein BWX80_02707 [Candidatus Hydrogenedentes bacterium ADurb.Bin101]|jgi:hypothetical protein|nr:MAG: hypothetical protein BWX80_02707 [Candidatus Hydrogenedentes bacterium ADurb.Bin101]